MIFDDVYIYCIRCIHSIEKLEKSICIHACYNFAMDKCKCAEYDRKIFKFVHIWSRVDISCVDLHANII